MQFGGLVVRGYRPSRMGGDEYDDESGRDRDEKVRLYALRAQAGLPLFDGDVEYPAPEAHSRLPHVAR